MAGIPRPLGVPEKRHDERSGALTQNEAHIILSSTLLPEHRSDPIVIQFITSYIRCRSISQAASESNIDTRSGYNLRNRPDIHLAIQKLTEKSLMKYGYDASEIVERVKEISNFDPIEMERPDGSFKKSMHEISPEARRVIKKMKVKNTYEKDPNGMPYYTGEIIEYEFYDKTWAHDKLGQEKDVFKQTTKVEHDVSKKMADVLLASARKGEDTAIEITGRVVNESEAGEGSTSEGNDI